MFFQLYTSGSSSLSRAPENNFTCLLLSKLHYSCGYLVLVLVSVAKPRKILSWFSNTNVPNKNIIIISQIIKVLRSLKKKKNKHSALTEWNKSIFWNSHLCPRREKTPELLKQYWDICSLLKPVQFSCYWKIIFNYYSIYHPIFRFKASMLLSLFYIRDIDAAK